MNIWMASTWIVWLIWWVSNLILKPKVIPNQRLYQMEVKKGRFDEKLYQRANRSKFNIKSNYGYDLSCELLEPSNCNIDGKRNLAVLCHGFTYSKYGSLIYAEIYLKLGFTVVIYDHRNHGNSGKALTSMGHYEKHDLKKVIDWCYEHFGEEICLMTHGESMGAATAIMHLAIDSRVKCVVADCGYSDLRMLLQHQMRRYYHFPRWMIPLESLLTYVRAGFWYREVSPIDIVRKTNVPIMFIHGKRDTFVPTYMAKLMYHVKANNKAIFLVAHAKHGESCLRRRDEYHRRVTDFVKRYMI